RMVVCRRILDDFRIWYVVRPIPFEMPTRSRPGPVRAAERRTQKPRLLGVSVTMLPQERDGLLDDFLLLKEAFGDVRHPDLGEERFPVGRISLRRVRWFALMTHEPGEIAVGAVVEPDELAISTQVHLPQESGVVARFRERSGKRRQVRRKHRRISPPARSHCFPPRAEGEPRGCTERC